MSESDKVFAGSIPENYDRYLVPLIFESFAADISQRAVALSPKAVLETAAGSGVVTRALAPKLSPDAKYVVTDLNQAMLDYAATRQIADSRISWRTADAQALPFEDASFDLVCCQFGAMFFPDRPSGYREAKRVLKRGGWFLFNVWDRIEENVFADDTTNALAELFPNDPPRFLARTPHGYHDTALIRGDLARQGFPTWISRPAPSRAAHPPPAIPRSPIVRARRYATRSKPEIPKNCRQQPTTPHPSSQPNMEAAKSLPRSRRTSSSRGPISHDSRLRSGSLNHGLFGGSQRRIGRSQSGRITDIS